MARLKKARAFTLSELIVVIVIIAVLVAIAAVTYKAVIDNSKKSAVDTAAAQAAKVAQSVSAQAGKAPGDLTTEITADLAKETWPTPITVTVTADGDVKAANSTLSYSRTYDAPAGAGEAYDKGAVGTN